MKYRRGPGLPPAARGTANLASCNGEGTTGATVGLSGRSPSLVKMKNETRRLMAVFCEESVCELVAAEEVTNEELLELDVDLLVPAALENQITAANAA
ncbi:MAG: hypothetical protein ACRDZ7_06835, partial [Acidimicrobiia bacterium]